MRIITILLVIVGMVAGWLLFLQHRKEREEHYWMTELESRLSGLLGHTSSLDPEPKEAPLFRLVQFMQEAEAANVDLSKMISDACTDLALDGSAAELVLESIMADYGAAKSLGIFDDPVNLIELEHGESAVISAAGWKGEKLAVAQIVPGLLAPDAAQCLPNLVLVPAMVRDAWSDSVTSYVVNRASQLEHSHFMSKDSLDRVIAAKPVEKIR